MRQVEEETLRKASAHGGLAGDGALQRVGGLVRLHFDEDSVASHVAGGHGHLHLVHVLTVIVEGNPGFVAGQFPTVGGNHDEAGFHFIGESEVSSVCEACLQ